MKIQVTDLTIGMYVEKLDRAWSDTPFIRHKFLIENQSQLKQLKSLCQTVEIDLQQSKLNASSFHQLAQKYPELTEEIKIEIDRSAKFLNLIISDITKSKSIANKSVQKAIQQILCSILATGFVSDYFERYLAPYPELVQKSLRNFVLTTAFAKHITLDKKKLTHLATAALLHDIGLARLPAQLLSKPKLSAKEVESIQAHLRFSVTLLKALSAIDKDVIEIVAQHHENLDGSGYDRGLSRSQIHFSAKVLRVVTIYEALTRNRAYADKKSKLQALTQLVALGENQKISSNLVSKFIEMLAVYPKHTRLQLKDGQTVEVIQDLQDGHEDVEADLILVETSDTKGLLLTVTRASVAKVIYALDQVVY